jgi:hypothetical protein
MLLLEPTGAAQAGGSRSGSVSFDCATACRSCARFCPLRRTKFSRNALANLASRAARSTLFFGVIWGGSLILRCNESAGNLSRNSCFEITDFRVAINLRIEQKSLAAKAIHWQERVRVSAKGCTSNRQIASVDSRASPRPCQLGEPRVLACARVVDGPRSGRCRSSVVEHSLGKGEVVGSIPTGSTTEKPNEPCVFPLNRAPATRRNM